MNKIRHILLVCIISAGLDIDVAHAQAACPSGPILCNTIEVPTASAAIGSAKPKPKPKPPPFPFMLVSVDADPRSTQKPIEEILREQGANPLTLEAKAQLVDFLGEHRKTLKADDYYFAVGKGGEKIQFRGRELLK